jgi:hypothetical protein
MTIIDRKRSLDYIKTFLAQYEQGGLLPVWELSSNETECMIGYHSVSVIADAAIKGIHDFNMEEAFQAMKKSAMTGDRYGLGAYMEKGCLSIEDESSSVSKTLEYAYDDYCIAQLAQLLHHENDYSYFIERSQYWKNLFDPKTGFIRPKKNGGWLEPFDPFEVNNNYTEANAWQYTFFVPQEIQSFIQKQGGPEKFEKKLDELFTAESKTTGRDQADITGMIGQYAHGNEPSHHMAYLYDYVGKPWKTQQRVRQILDNFYHASPDGLIGNEDCGQMSAWYVMSAIGLYDVTPGYGNFNANVPLFPTVIIHLENGKQLTVKTTGEVNQNSYIKSVNINGKSSNYSMIPYKVIASGGEINYELATASNTDRISTGWYGGKLSWESITEVPLINTSSVLFRDSMLVSITSFVPGDKIYFSLSEIESETAFQPYIKPFYVHASSFVKTFAERNGEISGKPVKSKIIRAHYYKLAHPDWKIKILSAYARQYSADGDEAMINGIRGDADWTKGGWQGYQGNMEFMVDLGKEMEISQVSTEFIQDMRSWILMPTQVEYSFSTDSIHFSSPRISKNEISERESEIRIQEMAVTLPKQNVRYIKVKAMNYGLLPEWHLGSGGQAWIFADEITVQ